jgi:hypothetical protein
LIVLINFLHTGTRATARTDPQAKLKMTNRRASNENAFGQCHEPGGLSKGIRPTHIYGGGDVFSQPLFGPRRLRARAKCHEGTFSPQNLKLLSNRKRQKYRF